MTKKLFFLVAFIALGFYMNAQKIEFVNNPKYTLEITGEVKAVNTLDVVIKNTGNAVLSVNDITFSDNVKIVSDKTFSVNAGESKTINIEISANENNKVTGYIIIHSNAINEPSIATKIKGGY